MFNGRPQRVAARSAAPTWRSVHLDGVVTTAIAKTATGSRSSHGEEEVPAETQTGGNKDKRNTNKEIIQ